jgi:hypothetical protein
VADSWVQSRANRLSRLLAEPVEELDGGEPDFLQSEPDGHLWVTIARIPAASRR